MNLPKSPDALYRPKADRATLVELIDRSWQKKQEEFLAQHADRVGLIVAEQLEALYPLEDLKVLQRYGAAEMIESTVIRIYNAQTKYWDASLSVKLSHPVLTLGRVQLTALRPSYWDEPNKGISPEYREKMTTEEWNKAVLDQEKADALQLSRSLDPFFEELLEMRVDYRFDVAIPEWVISIRKAKGKYPTWREIVKNCPVLLHNPEVKGWNLSEEIK